MDRSLILPHLIARRAQETPERVYLEDVAGPSLTYARTHEMARRWARAFQRLGVRPDHTVLSMLPTGFDAVGAWLGLGWLRAIEVPVNTAYQGRMLRYVIENSRAEVLVIAERYLPRLAEVADGLSLRAVVVPDADGAPAPFRALGRDGFFAGADRAEAPAEATLEGPDHWDIATILYTSGTTGPSKGVLVPWAQIYATTTGSMVVADLGPEDAYYCPFPLFHISGKGPLSVMARVGGRVVLRERFDTGSFWSDIARHRCTTTLLLGAMANFIYRQEPRGDDADTPQYLGLVAAGNTNPTARVEYALRADELLSEPQVRQIMEYYLAVRMRRFGRAFQPSDSQTPTARPNDRSLARSQPANGGPVVAGVGQASSMMSARPMGRPLGRNGRP